MKGYLVNRKTKAILKYGLRRRTEAVIHHLQRFSLPNPCIVLDIGTADGLMLRSLIEHCRSSSSIGIGIDTRFRYLESAKENVTHAVQADGRRLPLRTNSVDVIILAAVFKHVRGLESLLVECHRVLGPDGKIIATDPTPLGIRLGILRGYFSRQSIAQTPDLRATQQMLTRCGFKVIYAERFMLSPIPFIGSDAIERALKRAHLDQLFFNQVTCAECSTGQSMYDGDEKSL
jgi:SAM-dependent methyltransferase